MQLWQLNVFIDDEWHVRIPLEDHFIRRVRYCWPSCFVLVKWHGIHSVKLKEYSCRSTVPFRNETRLSDLLWLNSIVANIGPLSRTFLHYISDTAFSIDIYRSFSIFDTSKTWLCFKESLGIGWKIGTQIKMYYRKVEIK